MELRDLRYFVTLAREGNLSKAAQTLGITQSALSKSLARLEGASGARLVLRLPRGVELTEQGQLVLKHAERMAAMTLDACAAVAASQRVAPKVLRLGLGLGELEGAMPALVARFVGQFPEVRLDVSQGTSEQLSAALVRGDLDAVIGPPPLHESADTLLTPLGAEVYAAVCSQQHPRRATLRSLADLVQERWAVPWMPTRVGQWLGGLAGQRGLPLPSVALRCDAVPTLLSAIAMTDCVGYFSRAMVARHPLRARLALLPIDEIHYVKPQAFISRAHNAQLPLVNALREMAVAAMGPQPPTAGPTPR